MKYTLTAAFVLAFAQSVLGLTVNTPQSLVVCQPILLTWSDGTGPYFPSVIPGGQPSGQALKSFDKTDAQSLTWIVDLAAGTSVTIALKDSTGATAFTDALTIQPNSDTSCLNGSSSPAGTAPATTGATGATTGPAATTAAGGTTTAAAGGATAAASGSGASASGSRALATSARPSGTQAAAASASASNGAVRTSVTYGLAGVLAAVGAALF